MTAIRRKRAQLAAIALAMLAGIVVGVTGLGMALAQTGGAPTPFAIFWYLAGTPAYVPVSNANPLPVTTSAAAQNAACPSTIPISVTGSTDLHTFTAKGHICSIMLISAAQQGLSLSEGTGSVCAGGTVYLMGGAGGTLQVPANGGFSAAAFGPFMNMGTSGDHLCLLLSGSGNVSGYITYADN